MIFKVYIKFQLKSHKNFYFNNNSSIIIVSWLIQ